MTFVDPVLKDRLSAEVRTQAAAWLARLHGPNRTARVEKGFRRWLQADPNHGLAFELVTDVWDRAGLVHRTGRAQRKSRNRVAVAALAAAVLLCVVGGLFYLRSDTVVTAIGEQRILTLDDGSRMFLNTATRAQILYDARTRRVRVDAGEALFEVVGQPERPFVVVAGEQEILALGTAFVVRRDEDKVAVTLVEGRIRVATIDVRFTEENLSRESGLDRHRRPQVLTPGQRLTFIRDTQPRLDEPAVEKVTAWRQGQVALDDIPLIEAVTEMNRYSRHRLAIERSEALSVRISGIFRAGDSLNFARAVAKTYRLEVIESGKEIVLAGVPSAPLEPRAR